MKKYDYLIIGSGLFGSVFAQQMTEHGFKCLIIEKRNHLGGNCYTREDNGIHVHQYGSHIFHTNSKKIWDYMNRWTTFNNFTYRPKVIHKNNVYSFPINMMTLHQLWGVKTPEEAIKKLNEVKINFTNPQNLEEWILSQVGEEIYYKFIYGYTKKQWGKEPNLLPSFIIKRLPIRLEYNDNYFTDEYQGIPSEGYTKIFERMLEKIDFEYGIDYLKNSSYYNNLANKIVYTGPIDEFFDYKFGALEWRSLSFVEERYENLSYQGNAVMNFTEESVPYTRLIEHKFFDYKLQKNTIITKEYPKTWNIGDEKYYPINDEKNNILLLKYKNEIDNNKFIFGGRLADYKYYDMHQVVGEALAKSEKERRI